MFKSHYNQSTNIESNSSLSTCAKACKLIALSHVFSAISSLPQLLRCEVDMIVLYCVVLHLQCCYAWVVMSNAIHGYWKCYINVVTRTCLEFYWYICTLPRVLHPLWGHAYNYISQTPHCSVTIGVTSDF